MPLQGKLETRQYLVQTPEELPGKLLKGGVETKVTKGVTPSILTLEKLASIEWSKGYLFDVHVDGPTPANFTGFLPVESFHILSAGVENKTFEIGQIQFKVPVKSTIKNVKVKFFDDETGSVENYFEEWINYDIFGDGDSVNYLSELIQFFYFHRLNTQRNIIYTTVIAGYPDSDLSIDYDSSANCRVVSVTLNVSGYSNDRTNYK